MLWQDHYFWIAICLFMLAVFICKMIAYERRDQDTNTYNAKYFDQWIREQKPSKIHNDGLLIIDLSKMLRTSGLYSQEIANTLICNLASQFLQLQKEPLIFRLKSSIFIIVTKSKEEQQKLSNKISQLLQQCFFIKGKHINCHGKLISATEIHKLTSVEQLLPYIDFLLEHARKQTNSPFFEDNEEILQQFIYEQKVESYLQYALEHNLFEVYYQPAFNLKKQCFTSIEALSRLYIEKLGWISPELFMRLASNNGMILQIMPMQVEAICKFVAEHKNELSAIESMKINLTPNEIIEPGYCQQLLDIISKYQLPYSFFQFEIVESTATQYTEELTATVKLLQEAGVSLCLDDFGSGFANLNTVLRLPFKVIKLDRSLLRDICKNQPAAIFYRSLVQTFNSLGYKLVAEGVENAQEAELLKQWQVEAIQGYYYAKPMPEDELIKLLKEK